METIERILLINRQVTLPDGTRLAFCRERWSNGWCVLLAGNAKIYQTPLFANRATALVLYLEILARQAPDQVSKDERFSALLEMEGLQP